MSLPLRSALELLASPRARHRNDESTFEALRVQGDELQLPTGLSLQWLGTAGFRLGFEGTTVLVDPYVSRCSSLQVFNHRPLHVDTSQLAKHVPRADAVLVGHTHFDHALDIPAIARRDDCMVYGSPSLSHLMDLHGLAQKACVVEHGKAYEVGPFKITFVPSVHSKLLLGLKVPYEGELTCDHLDHLHGGAYRCGQVYGILIEVAGRRFYHQGSANLIEEAVPRGGVDYFLCGIAGRGFTRDYVSRIVHLLQPTMVIPHHFDDFFRGVDEHMGFSLNVNLGGFVEELQKVSKDIPVHTLGLLQTV